MKYICALITVENIQKSRQFYEGILHQKVITDFGENIGFEGGFALHKRDHFSSLIDNRIILKESNAFELYFEEDDLAVVEKSLQKEGIEFIHGIKEQPWRQQVIRFYDYDKNIIEIGERLEHEAYRLYLEKINIEEIMRYTYLNKESIEKAIVEYSK
jgi:catechol 2,3-dioxygenase-like lactoylglutathione lyase family enzyme